MRFGVLGPLAVWTTKGDQVVVPELKVRALLADLLAHAGNPVSTDRLVEDLWGEELPVNPAAVLQLKVSRLRRVLEDAEPGGRDLVVSRPPGYLLRAEAGSVDMARFQDLVERARGTADTRARVELLSSAFSLWRGEAFADFGDYPFTRALAARLEDERLDALEEQVEARLALGEHGRLASELGDLVIRYPLRERLRAAHMRALYRAGRQGDALESYRELRERLADELGVDPGPALAGLYEAILNQDPALDAAAGVAAPAEPPRTNLPAPVTELIGRDGAVSAVCTLLGSGRLVTLTGPGGVGKTRLAVETATRLVSGFSGGVWLVELAALGQSGEGNVLDALTEAVMAVLGIREDAAGGPGGVAGQLAAALRDKELLLVLDNCEHVVSEVAELVDLLTRTAPALRVLATSREPLGLAGEVRWAVPPLELPDRAADQPAVLGQSSAVRLFVARAAAAAPGFKLSADNARAVGLLCRRLDGIPLALELAATRVRALGVEGLLTRLDDRFRLLATGHRGAPPRQQTLRAMIDWSWGLLTEPERVVLRRLAIHSDGCTLEAAERVCAGDTVDGADVLDLLARLVDRSLVVAVEVGDGVRYRLLESVAEYCVERLREQDDLARLRCAHHRYYLELAELAEPHLYRHGQRKWLRRLDNEAANLRAAIDGLVRSAAADEALRMVNALAWYWYLRGRIVEARRWLAMALETPGPASDTARLRARAWQAGIGLLAGDSAALEQGDSVLKLYEGVDDTAGRAKAQWFLGFVGNDLGDLSASEDLVDRALVGFRALGDRWGVAAALSTTAKIAMVRGDLDALKRNGERSVALFRELGDRWGELQATDSLGYLAEVVGDFEQATQLHWEGLRTAEELGLWPDATSRLSWLGRIAMLNCDYEQARDFHEQALRLATDQSYKPGQIFAEMGLGISARRQGKLDIAETHLRTVLDQLPRENLELGNTLPLGFVLAELGFLAEQRGDPATARALHEEGLAVARHLVGDRRPVALNLEGLAGAESLAGRHARAAELLGAAAAARDSGNAPLAPTEADDVHRITAKVKAALGEDLFAERFECGRSGNPAEAVFQA
ncbi:BTAD domain-containing putative transcriptional regulator [Amycolatopsis anabasis]|uniref:BTAD domain-containing putative transcriptional regulator n=1 Tax=Amycolatopsis anabasis TaxID=1840409 RepID=UPI00131BF042|nr:BTAD domain-containing putative transcriptional regulator [Amycolatopsis anabasis]